MLLHDSRRNARLDEAGDLILMEDQIGVVGIIHKSLRRCLWWKKPCGVERVYALQATIAALHCQAAHAEETDWSQIVRLYAVLERLQPSPIVTLNRSVAIAMAESPQTAFGLLNQFAPAELDSYYLFHATRANLCQRVGAFKDAIQSYKRALEVMMNNSERRFLERRLREVQP